MLDTPIKSLRRDEEEKIQIKTTIKRQTKPKKIRFSPRTQSQPGQIRETPDPKNIPRP